MTILDTFTALEATRIRDLGRLTMLDRYATGDHPLPDGSDQWKDYYRKWQRRSRTNYCGLAAASVAERLRVDGFRGPTPEVESAARSWWQSNRLDSESMLVHSCAAELGTAFVFVGSRPGGGVRITPESPKQVTVDVDPANPSAIRSAAKVWQDGDTRRGELYLPDRIVGFESAGQDWKPVSEVANPIGVVPVVRFTNRSRLGGGHLAEFEDAIDIQDRINSTVLNLLSIAQAQAFRQRWVKGLDLTDEHGNDVDPPFEAVVSALWAVEDTNVEFGEFQQVDLRPLLDSLKSSIEAFVTLTGLPPHYVAGDLVNASADALAAAEARLVAKVRARQLMAGQSWEDVITLAGRVAGVDIPDSLEVIWHDAERKTDAQRADAALKAAQFGVPWRQRMEDYGYTPDQIERMLTDREAEAEFDARAAGLTSLAALGVDDERGEAPADSR